MAAKIVDNNLERVSDFDNETTTNIAESLNNSESNESKKVQRIVAD